MLTVFVLLIFSVVFTAGNPFRVLAGDEQRKEGEISNLQLLLPMKDVQHHKNKKHKHYRGQAKSSPGHLKMLPDDPYSDIPSDEFVLDDATIYFEGPKKTIKKDLSQVDAKSNEENNARLSFAPSVNKDVLNSETLLKKCRKILQIEQLRSQWTHLLKRSIEVSEDYDLLFSLCKVQLGLGDKQIQEQKAKQVPSAGNFGVGGSGGVSGNMGVGGQGTLGGNVAVNGLGGVAGNMGIKGIGGFAGNVGMGGKGTHAGTGNELGDNVAFQILNGLGFNSGNLGIDGQGGFAGNAGFNGEGDTAGNVGIGGKGGQAGNLGVGGKGGIAGNLGIGGQGGFFGNVGIGSNANQYFDYYPSGGQSNLLNNLLSRFQNKGVNYDGLTKVSLNYPSTSHALGSGLIANNVQLGSDNNSAKAGNDGVNGQVVAENDAVVGSSGGNYGSVGVGGVGKVAGNVVLTGALGQNVAGQGEYLGNLAVGEGNQGHPAGQGIVSNEANGEVVGQNLKQAGRADNSIDQDNVRCYIGSLAYGGKGGQIGNLAINGGGGNQHSCCDHSLLVYLVGPKVARSREGNGNEDDGKMPSSSTDVSEDDEAVSESPDEEMQVQDVSKFRPMGGRRDWMVLNGMDDRLRQYLINRKQ